MPGLCEREISVVKPPAEVWAYDKSELIKQYQFLNFKIFLHSEEVKNYFLKVSPVAKKLER